MNPSLLDYMAKFQPNAQTEVDQAATNPFSSGSQSAVQAAKQSMQMDERERGRAQGLAALQFAAHMAQRQHGRKRSFSESLNQSLLPAVETYNAERNRIEQQNAYLHAQAQAAAERQRQEQLRLQMHQEKMQQRQQEQEALERHRTSQLGETERYHQGRLGLEREKAQERTGSGIKEWEEAAKYNALPLNNLSVTARREYEKGILADKKNFPDYKKAIKTVHQMQDIFSHHPNIGESFTRSILSGKMENPSAMHQLARKYHWNKDEISALQKLQKLSSDLNLQSIKSSGGKVATDLFKQMIRQAAPSEVLTPDAFDFVAKNFEEDFKSKMGKTQLREKGLINGYYIPEEENWAQQEVASEAAPVSEVVPPKISQNVVTMQTPDGQTWQIPKANVEAAKARGAVEIAK